ncbi:hypothetical protein MNBD_ALPHA11-402 [hydrothermal vent metagenome]|uniref:Uncharacterized protein n=1 Tax=hydrothermal vent metagenome TaxID=652676 RepID=A0A3B0ULP0_9ZZZZ
MSLFNIFRRGKASIPARFTAPVIAGLIASLAFFIGPATAQTSGTKNQQQSKIPVEQNLTVEGIDFGTNTSDWADDGECDDPRFIGIGSAVDMNEIDMGRDAQDCSTLFLAGDISLKPDPADIVGDIDFGSNTSDWADNDICDDPRFGGPGTDELLLDEDIGRDANDCKNLFLAGQVNYLGDDPNMEIINFDGILFGDNTSRWANDAECDDPRFTGTGMATELVDDDLEHDATDCLTLYQAGSISMVEDTETTATAAVDFGNNSSQWANDGECDDPRFAGSGVAAVLLDEDLGRDATDCSQLFESGDIYLVAGTGSAPDLQDTYFGNDTSRWANDGECDDPRFTGNGMASQLDATDMGQDATDCKNLVNEGQVEFITAANVDFGDDSSEWSNDGECDDPRFTGPGSATKLDPRNFGRDATDCQALLQSGQVDYVGGVLAIIDSASLQYNGDANQGNDDAPSTGTSGIDWGNDSSSWANDGECDDPRFAGPGVASTLLDEDLGRDATDCSTLFQQGQIQLVQGDGQLETDQPAVEPTLQPSTATDGELNFGDDTSAWANDGECDDPRFTGPGSAASPLSPLNLLKDATDCQTLFENGSITLI